MSFTICILFFNYLSQVEEPSTESILILIAADLLIKICFKIYSVRLLSDGEAIRIRQKESNWMNFLHALPYIGFLFLAIHIFPELESSLKNKMSIFLLLYYGLTSFLFSNKRGDFYVDSLGLIQPELLKKNYKWSEIENFGIHNDTIEFKLEEKDYKIQITEKEKSQLKNLIMNKSA